MIAKQRLRICYAAPGQDMVLSMGPTRNVVSLARALAKFADVTVAFRRIGGDAVPEGLRVLEIDPMAESTRRDDAATSGIGYLQFLRYLRTLRRFVQGNLADFDVVLEKSWLLSGYMSAFRDLHGRLGVPVENIVQNAQFASRQRWPKRLRMQAAGWLVRRNLRHARLVIAETEFLKTEIHAHWRVPLEHIAVVDLGVDRQLFKPAGQAEARRALGLSPDTTILTYVGVLDWTHDLAPAIEAVARSRRSDLELEIVGDGARREEYARMAAAAPERIRFRGRVAHERVPLHIAAADLCLAPYNASAFASGELGYSTMKIPEYLAVGRPVASVPGRRIRSLVTDGVAGFLFENSIEAWTRFLGEAPDRARLAEMGRAAADVELPTWDDTASAYYALCQRALAS
jgi:glycosyltransferase involved in cell wall biosynthesis